MCRYGYFSILANYLFLIFIFCYPVSISPLYLRPLSELLDFTQCMFNSSWWAAWRNDLLLWHGFHLQVVKEKSRPYVDQVKTLAAPHLERVHTLAGPHYRRALTTANSYHAQVQSHLKDKLEKYEFSSSLATTQFIWLLAAAILALPFVTVFMFLRSLYSPKKAVHHKRHRSSHSGSSTSKKPRRSRQADKQFEN